MLTLKFILQKPSGLFLHEHNHCIQHFVNLLDTVQHFLRISLVRFGQLQLSDLDKVRFLFD
jgi:hypothetical protein